eukprot:scaffold19434_cov121-Skeletonema_dohrnii-CCMP3373.AAC.6
MSYHRHADQKLRLKARVFCDELFLFPRYDTNLDHDVIEYRYVKSVMQNLPPTAKVISLLLNYCWYAMTIHLCEGK